MLRKIIAALFFMAPVMFLAPAASADVWNKETRVTFAAPVEVPGTVLAPGTYVFRLADSDSNRNIVQIFNAREDHLYATILGIPDTREEPAAKSIFNFDERPMGSPEALREWFYPGDTDGTEFVYPKDRAMQLAKASQSTVPAMPSEMAKHVVQPVKSASQVQALKQAPITAVTPQQKEVQIASARPPRAPVAQKADNHPAKQLPKTASELPQLILIGLVALAVGLAALFVINRVS